MTSLYQRHIMDRYHFPRHKGTLEGPQCVSSQQANPSCGDQISLFVCTENEIIVKASFTGVGCMLSIAAADMLIDEILGKRAIELAALTAADMQRMIGIAVGPTRLKCILLPLQALQSIHA